MPSLRLLSDASIIADIHLTNTARDVITLDIGGGVFSVEIAGIEAGVRFTGPISTVLTLLEDAVEQLRRRQP